jgi:hypothetical protein
MMAQRHKVIAASRDPEAMDRKNSGLQDGLNLFDGRKRK